MKQKLLLVLSFMLVTLGLQAEEVSVKFSEKGYTNSQVVTSCEFGNGITATFSKGSNANTSPAYYNTGSAFRLYGGNTMTITAPSNVTINSVVMTTKFMLRVKLLLELSLLVVLLQQFLVLMQNP